MLIPFLIFVKYASIAILIWMVCVWVADTYEVMQAKKYLRQQQPVQPRRKWGVRK